MAKRVQGINVTKARVTRLGSSARHKRRAATSLLKSAGKFQTGDRVFLSDDPAVNGRLNAIARGEYMGVDSKAKPYVEEYSKDMTKAWARNLARLAKHTETKSRPASVVSELTVNQRKQMLIAFSPLTLGSFNGNRLHKNLVETAKIGPEHIYGNLIRPDTLTAIQEVLATMLYTKQHAALHITTQAGKTEAGSGIALFLNTAVKSNPDFEHVLVALAPFGRKSPMASATNHLNAACDLNFGLFFPAFPNATVQGASIGLQPRRTNTRRQWFAIIQECIANGKTEIWLIRDEADFGANWNGGFSDFMRDCKRLGITVRMIGVSATPEEYAYCDNFRHIEVIKTKETGYQGLIQGEQLRIHSMEQLATALKLPALPSLVDGSTPTSTVTKTICALIEKLSGGFKASSVNLNGKPFNGGSSMVIRLTAGTEEAVKEVKAMAKKKKMKLKVIKYADTGILAGFTPRQVLEAYTKDGSLCVMFVKGIARRATEFDKTTALYLDFTGNYSKYEAYKQGMIGRASGYKGDNVAVFVSTENYQTVLKHRADFARTGKDRAPKPYTRAVRLHAQKIARVFGTKQINSVAIMIDELPKDIRRNVADGIIAHHGDKVKFQKTAKGRVRISHAREDIDFYGTFHNKATFTKLEQIARQRIDNHTARLLRPGKQVGDYVLKRKMVKGVECAPFIYANADKQALTARTGLNAGDSASERTHSLVFRNKGGKIIPVGIFLYFDSKVDDFGNSIVKDAETISPTHQSAYNEHFLSKKRQTEVREATNA